MIKNISPQELKRRIQAYVEIALIDVRDEGLFVEAHILHARNIALKDLASRICLLVPRRNVPTVIVDDGDNQTRLAAEAFERLVALGYNDVAILDGGIAAWRSANFELFSGTHVPSKAFGEFVELSYSTPHMSPTEVKALIDDGADLVILDSRSFDEYQRMSIPGAISLPGAELVYRIYDLVQSPKTLIIVNCAGRTRSIIGAQSLINAGIPNKVAALRDGTSGWQLAGLALEYGRARVAPRPTDKGLRQARKAAAVVAARYDVKHISREQLTLWKAESESRSLYMFDVRTPSEYAAGHLDGTRSAPGGQLIQATDEFVGVLGARIVLVDDDGIRAVLTASWLIQMGWPDVAVLQIRASDKLIQSPPITATNDIVTEIQPVALQALLNSSLAVMVVDFARAESYSKGHLPGAVRLASGDLKLLSNYLANLDMLIVTAQDDVSAHMAANEIVPIINQSGLRVLSGGTTAWTEAGLPLEMGEGRVLQATNQLEGPSINSARSLNQELQKYLAWEVGLVEQVKRDGDVKFLKISTR